MTNFIKLTNNTDAHKGNPIFLNVDHITAVYDIEVQGGGIKTIVYGGYGAGVSWEVEESPKTVIDMIMPVEYL
jgi:hypothetical protein